MGYHPPHVNPPTPPKVPKLPVRPNYPYDASEPAAIVFTVLFALTLLVHTGQAIRYRTLWVWPLILGLVLETEGFLMRYLSIAHLYTKLFSLVHQISVIVAPAFIAAQNYMLVGRLMSYLGKEFSPVSHTLITKIFVVCDLVSIVGQGVGAALLNSHDYDPMRTGFNLLIFALVFQVVMFLIFVGITIVFDRRSKAALGKQRRPVEAVFIAFYISAALIIWRSIYRTAEFASVKFGRNQPATGYALDHEWLIYAFDAVPIVLAAVTLNIIHAGRYLPQKKGLRIDGTEEEPQPSRVCGCFCVYRRPRKVMLESAQRGRPSHQFGRLESRSPAPGSPEKSYPLLPRAEP